MNSKTIDGVPREPKWCEALLKLEVVREALTSSDSAERLKNMDAGKVLREGIAILKELRALLDARDEDAYHACSTHGDTVEGVCGACESLQPKGDQNAEWEDSFGPDYTGEPAALTMKSVMAAICSIDGFPMLTSNQCHALAVKLNAERPAPVDDGTTSNKYRAELYDEVWQRARDLGFANVTDALSSLERKGESVGKVVINSLGYKAVSFEDSVWSSLPVGQLLYARHPDPELGEPYAYEYEFATVLYKDGPGKFKKVITNEPPDQHEIDAGSIINVKPLYALGPRKYDDTLLPFLAMMRKELHENSHKGDREGWLGMDRETAMAEVHWHVKKLWVATEVADLERITEHAADVANMAMMLLDVCNGLPRNN